jgi:redox-sensitive bicupin YhaK (pirin superfamily)
METVTYMLEGTVRHRDSLGNSGTIGKGDLQWMSAGSGIVHEEMPQRSPLGVKGLQLWVNLPRAEKMKDPEYRDAPAPSVPSVEVSGGTVKPLAGTFRDIAGPVSGVARDPAYFDIALRSGAVLDLETPPTQTCFAYVYSGELAPEGAPGEIPVSSGSCVLFGPGDLVRLRAGSAGCSLVFARAEPLKEPIAWGGPIVMNTNEELEKAFDELDKGTFVKVRRK